MSIINNGLLLASGADAAVGYQISRSLRFNSADSAYLSRTPGSAGNQKTYTLSMWIKRSKLGQKYFFGSYFSNLSRYQYLGFNSSDQLEFFGGVYTTGGSTTTHVNLSTTAVYRDVSAWYHLVLAVDTTQATSTNRVKLYVNGTQVTDFGTATYPAQNSESYINSVQAHYLGDWGGGGSISLDGYIADVYLLDGTATTPSTFAETDAITGQWVPKTPTSISYGTNGFRLTFSDNSGTTSTTLGKDSAGSNNWTPNNFSVASGSGNDSLVDSPTSYGTPDTGVGGEVRGNYCTWNPLDNAGTLANGNLDFSNSASSNQAVRSTFALPESGKWYAEFTTGTLTNGSSGVAFGFANSSASLTAGPSAVNRWTIYADAVGYIFANNSTLTSSLGTFAAGTVLQIAYDAATGKAWVGKNNTWYNSSGGTTGDPAAGTNQTFTLSGTQFLYTLCFANSGVLNAGARPFAYTAPSGFKALCDTNLTSPTIAKPANYFDVKLYTGNGSTQTISGLGFSPDLAWIKVRNGAVDHVLYDQIRGTQRYLSSNTTGAEGNQTGTPNVGLYAFTSDGFSVGDISGGSYGVNGSSGTYVAWAWDAASSNSTNTSGTITSTVRANATAGFSIVTYTGTGANATVGHGCGAAPSMMLVKSRSAANGWAVYHASIGNTYELILNSTSAVSGPNGTYWNSTSPTSTVFSLGTDSWGNANGGTYVAYCFAPVAGYSAFGSYTGNGSSDGPFVFTGFRPRWVMIKCSSSAQGGNSAWMIVDAVRNTYNAIDNRLHANLSDSEYTNSNIIDFTANGFKLRTAPFAVTNTSAETYVWAAFAESPFQYARAR